MAEERFSIVESWRAYISFMVGVTSPRPMAFDTVDLWAFASVSIVLDKVASEFPRGHGGMSGFHFALTFVPYAIGMAWGTATMLVGWIVSAGYAHVSARFVGGQASFTATLHSVVAVLTCTYGVVSLGVLGFMLAASALGAPHGKLAAHVTLFSVAAQFVMLMWLLPMRLGVVHSLTTGQRVAVALMQLLPAVVLGMLLYGAVSFLNSMV